MKVFKEHFWKLVIASLFALTAFAARTISENQTDIVKNKLHIDYMREDLKEIKKGVATLLKR